MGGISAFDSSSEDSSLYISNSTNNNKEKISNILSIKRKESIDIDIPNNPPNGNGNSRSSYTTNSSDDEASSEDYEHGYIGTKTEITYNDICDNNLLFTFQQIGIGKEYISGASCYPPRLSTNGTVGGLDEKDNSHTVSFKDGGSYANYQENDHIFSKHQFIDVKENNSSINCIFSNSTYEIDDTKEDGHIILTL